jgi:hypothetical protein
LIIVLSFRSPERLGRAAAWVDRFEGDEENILLHNIYNVNIYWSTKARQVGMDEEGGHVPLLSKRLHVPESSVIPSVDRVA